MISVIMGVHKVDSYLNLAIDSILNQTLTGIELIIVANGEFCDQIEKYILECYFDTSNIYVYKSVIPQLAHALNTAIDKSRFDYVARMDADDIAWPKRLELQFEYLKANNIDLVGSAARLIDSDGKVIGVRNAMQGASINNRLPFRSMFIHPTILAKKSVIVKARGYCGGFNSEDSDLWLRLRRIGTRWDNMLETLLDYRIHDAASQGDALGYAEDAGYALREFILERNFTNFAAIPFKTAKSIFLPKKDR